PAEPDLWLIGLVLCTAIGLAIAGRDDARRREPALMALVFFTGMALLPVHGALFGTTMLEWPRYGTYEARIAAVIYDDGEQQRWILSDITADANWTVPDVRLARVSVSSAHSASVGDTVTARIRFYPVPPPAVPGGYDSQFASYFDGIGAYGNVFEAVVTPAEECGPLRLVEQARSVITARVVGQLGDSIG